MYEHSAGGVVWKNRKILMVRVRNLEGKIVWTFPKGHLEKGETALQAALREVWEETGWNCVLARSKKPFTIARYRFQRNNRKVFKDVIWYLLRPLRRTGKKDSSEILQVGWFSMRAARQKIVYPSDCRLLEQLREQRISSVGHNRLSHDPAGLL